MGVQEDIFESFFKRLRDARLPIRTVIKLRKLWKNKDLQSEEKLLNMFREEVKDAHKNQNH